MPNSLAVVDMFITLFWYEKKLEYELFHRNLSDNDCSKMLTEQKKHKTWLKEVDSTALIQSLRNLETAFKRFFKKISNYPRYKSKYNPVQSYNTINNNNRIRIEKRKLRLPKVGMVNFSTRQEISGTISSVTVRRSNSGKYYAAILCKDVSNKIYKWNERCCGIDLGIVNFVTINTGEIIQFLQENKIKRLNKKIEKIHRILSRKETHSNNREKTKEKTIKVL